MTTAVASPSRTRICPWNVLLLVGIVDAIVGSVGVAATSGALLVASWVLLVAGVDAALFAVWKVRRRS